MKLRLSLAAVALALLPTTALSQDSAWPNAPVRLVVPYPPGSSGDVIVRKIAPTIAEKAGGTFYVENRPGANGDLGMEVVKNSPADGYTFVVGSDIQFSISPALYPDLVYDVEKDFTLVAPVALIDLVLVANKGLEANTYAELVELAKAKPGEITYGSTGVGSSHQLHVEQLKILSGFDALHIPYSGTGQATPDLISGEVNFMFLGVTQALAQVEAGQLKALAVGSTARNDKFPDVPTLAESVPDFTANNIWGIWAPSGTPEPIVTKLRDAISQALVEPDIQTWYRDSLLSTMDGGVEELAADLAKRRARWVDVIKASNIRPEK